MCPRRYRYNKKEVPQKEDNKCLKFDCEYDDTAVFNDVFCMCQTLKNVFNKRQELLGF